MSDDDPRRYLLAYDIADDHRRNRVSKLLERFGDRVQYSVFVLQIRPAKLVRLQDSIKALIVNEQDSVLVCDLGGARRNANGRMTFIGRDRPITPNDVVIL